MLNQVQLKIEELVKQYKYKPLPEELSKQVRRLYEHHLPVWAKPHIEHGSFTPLYSPKEVQIAIGFVRVVIGDYGAFIEIPDSLMIRSECIIAPGQEYRINDPKYKDRVKYIWLTTHLNDIKIYRQMKPVSYADYKPGFFYISPYELTTS